MQEREESEAAAELGTEVVTDLESEPDNAMGRTLGGTGEEAYLVANRSSGVERRMTNTLNFSGQGATSGTKSSDYKIKRNRV